MFLRINVIKFNTIKKKYSSNDISKEWNEEREKKKRKKKIIISKYSTIFTIKFNIVKVTHSRDWQSFIPERRFEKCPSCS